MLTKLAICILGFAPAAPALAQDVSPQGVTDFVSRLNSQSERELGVSLLALLELYQRRGTDFGVFVRKDYLEEDRSWNYVRELVDAGYLELKVQNGMGGQHTDHEFYTIKPTPKGQSVIEAMQNGP